MKRVNEDDLDYDYTDGLTFYEEELFSGEGVEVAEDGQILVLTTYKDGREEGPYREWHPNGKLLVEGQSKAPGGAVGTWRKWHSNGQIAEEKTFSDDGGLTSVRRWDTEGNIIQSDTYDSL